MPRRPAVSLSPADSLPVPDPKPEESLRILLGEELDRRIGELYRFVDRRFSELSVEVHGAVQMMDFSETNLSGQIGAVHAQIASLVAAPVEATRNSGLDLEAVVEATESAADRIMDAAEAISRLVEQDRHDPAGRAELASRVNAIFEACSFQDLTGQRIRRAISHLHGIEVLLEQMMSVPAGEPPVAEASAPLSAVPPSAMDTASPSAPDPVSASTPDGADLDQAEIDRLLG